MPNSLDLRNNLHYLFLCLLLILSLEGIAQRKKPKIALVLSGGGAKGIAHIPTLQALDSLGIVPDLIVGNSMGSIVGGLYALGYSGDSIASIAKGIDWNRLIKGRVLLKNVSVEEKSEFRQYLLEMDWVEDNIKLGTSLYNDQNIREFISVLTYPSYNIDDFDKLPIPFRALATDIVNGKEVVLDKGSLSSAMRASMSLPGIFSPVPYKETLLIDGGVLNNFPVDVAKKLGADIIIGSDVGDGMLGKDEINNVTDILFQAGMLSSNLKNDRNREMCDILINHIAHLTFSTGDFENTDKIYEEGKIALSENIYNLIALSKRLKKYKQNTVELPYIDNEILLDTIVYSNISKTNLALVKARTKMRNNSMYSKEDIVEGVNRAMGTTIFDQIIFAPLVIGDKVGIQLNGVERARHQFKGSLHYDNYHGAGILINYSGRNVIGNSSRLLVTLDIAKQLQLKIQNQKNFGKYREWWLRNEVLGQQFKQQIFIRKEKVNNIRYKYFESNNEFNRNINSLTSYLGLGLKYQHSRIKPFVKPENDKNNFGLKSYTYNLIQIDAHYVYNTLNKASLATNGITFKLNLERSLYNDVDVRFSKVDLKTQQGSTSNFTKLKINYEKRYFFNKKATIITGAAGNFIFVDNVNKDVSFNNYGLGAKYFIGGNKLNSTNNRFLFPGLKEGEVTASQFIKLNFGFQYNFKTNFYVIPHMHIATVGYKGFNNYFNNALTINDKWANSDETSFLFSSGIMLEYNSILGPLDFDISWVNGVNKFRFYIGIGFQLNRFN